MCAKEREKGFDKQWDPNSEKMKKRVMSKGRALAQALLEGEVEQTKNKQHIENLKATRDNILRMSAGTEEDDFSRMSREAMEKRRKKKALALDIEDDIASKDDTEDIIVHNSTTPEKRTTHKRIVQGEIISLRQWNPTFISNLVKHEVIERKAPTKRVSFKGDNKIQVSTNSIDDDSTLRCRWIPSNIRNLETRNKIFDQRTLPYL